MRRTTAKAAASKPTGPERPAEIAESAPNEQVQRDENKELMEDEEVEYEEVEEEIEVEEEEEIEEEEEEEAAQEEFSAANGKCHAGDDNMKDADEGEDEDEDDSDKYAELLALPPHGSEVYIGGIPDDASEEDLKSFCQSMGEVTEVRIIKVKDSSENKAYAFVTFRTSELATKAIKELNNTEIKGKKVKCLTSQAKNKLFIGDVPRHWSEDDMRRAVEKVGPGEIKVNLMKDPQNSSRNRGYAFIEYYNHACAEYSRKKMSTSKFKLDSNAPTVGWADPKCGESASACQVKALYIKNLPANVTEEQLEELFEHNGQITKVVLPPAKTGHEKRYAFVHFKERSMAMKALKNTQRYELDGHVLDCSIAKPPAEKKDEAGYKSKRGGLLPSYSPFRYSVIPGAYGAIPAGFGQPVIFGSRTPGIMVAVMLPDGRLGYALQPGQPAAAPQQRGGNRSRGDSRRGGRYQPY